MRLDAEKANVDDFRVRYTISPRVVVVSPASADVIFFINKKSVDVKIFVIMLTTLEKFGIIAIAVLGFQFTRWFSSVMYSQFLGPLYLHPKAKLKKLGKWAGK